MSCLLTKLLNVPFLAKGSYWRLPQVRRDEIEECRRASMVADQPNAFVITLDGSRVKTKQYSIPVEWPEIMSATALRRNARRIREICARQASQCSTEMNRTTDSVRKSHFAVRFRFYREQALKFQLLFTHIEQRLEDAELLATPARQYAGAVRVFHYLAHALYIARVSPGHELIVTPHRQLWKLAKLRAPPPPKNAELRDSFKDRYKRRVMGSTAPAASRTTASRSRPASQRSGPSAAPRRSTPASSTRGAPRPGRLPEHLMLGAPPSVATALAGKCLTCGGPHMANSCPAKDINRRTQDQVRAVAANQVIVKRIREKRNAWLRDARARR